jgi:hypothetical protein
MKVKLVSILIILSLLPAVLATSAPVQAAGDLQTAEYLLGDIGLDTFNGLQGPLDEVSVQFSLPPDWDTQNGTLQLDLTAFFGSLIPADTAVIPTEAVIG